LFFLEFAKEGSICNQSKSKHTSQ